MKRSPANFSILHYPQLLIPWQEKIAFDHARGSILFLLSVSISRMSVCLFLDTANQPIKPIRGKSEPISKSHRRNAANQQLICTDENCWSLFLLQHSQIAHSFLLLQQLLTPRDQIELLISFLRSEAWSEVWSIASSDCVGWSSSTSVTN